MYDLETELQQNYPTIVYMEISVLFNIYLQNAMAALADQLKMNTRSYAAQRISVCQGSRNISLGNTKS